MSKPTGFTLIETLIAISVLTIAVVGPYTIANNAIRASRVSQNEVIASFLAQEALDYIREVKDTALEYRITNPGSSEAIAPIFSFFLECLDGYCTIDSVWREMHACPIVSGNPSCPALYYDGQIYNQKNEGQKTAFTRSVQVASGYYYTNHLTVTVTVSWAERGKAYSYTIEETLYDWLGYAN